MKNKKIGVMAVMACSLLCLFSGKAKAYASDGEEYITISVAATDDNGNLKYALDTDDPDAFTDSNEFTIPAGTSHTIYVKDVAGNITSQEYYPDKPDETDNDGQKINIDLEIGGSDDKPDYSNYEYLTDDPVEPGTGSTAEKIITDGSGDSERVFYTFTTKEGEVLYMVIDQSRSSDNVYLLDTVSVSDLLVLADGSGNASSAEKKEDNLLSALSKEENVIETESNAKEEKQSGSNPFIVFIFVAIAGGVYYYFKIYKNKKEESMDMIDDAMNMDEFEAESEEDDEIEFDFDDAEKEKFLEELINEDDESLNLYDTDPEEYANMNDAGLLEDYENGEEEF